MEGRRKVLRSRKNRIKHSFPITVSNKLQLTQATNSYSLKQPQTSAGIISKPIVQPELEESSAQDLLHIAGTTLGRRYFFSKQTASEFTWSMTIHVAQQNHVFYEISHPIWEYIFPRKNISRPFREIIMNPNIVTTAQPSYAEFLSSVIISLFFGTAGKR